MWRDTADRAVGQECGTCSRERRTAELAKRLDGILAIFTRPNVLAPALNNPNFLIHPAPMLLNYAAVERAQGQLSIMNEGMTPAVLRCMDAVDAEKMAVEIAYGLEPITVDDIYREIGSSPDIYRKPGEPFNIPVPGPRLET